MVFTEVNDSLKVDRNTHFEFGKNRAAYSRHISDQEIVVASKELIRLVGAASIEDLSFLDIGRGEYRFQHYT